MGGRRPKPTALKLVRATQRASRVREGEPEAPAGPVIRPGHLKYREVELWDEYAPMLEAMGTLTPVDVPLFATWCQLAAKQESSGADMPASLIAQMRLLAAELGIGASARAKIGQPRKPEDRDPAEEFFKKKHGKKTG
jgi:phage terminase small subunit